MKLLVLTFLKFFDFFHKKKILKSLKLIMNEKENTVFDVGAHHGETVKFINKNFIVSKFFSFEPLEVNFVKLKKNTKTLNNNITYFNLALGEKKQTKMIKEMLETSSSTLNEIDETSNYFKRKKFFLGLRETDSFYKEKKVFVEKGINIIRKFRLKKIDLLKIDTEGYEFSVIKGFESDIKKVQVVLFEHHYDLMIKKKYKYSDINIYLKKNGFKLKSKYRMPFRKTFEYIYLNNN